MASNSEIKLKLYPMEKNEFIGTVWIDVDENANDVSNSVETVVLIDRSGSMGSATKRLINEILPLALSKLSHEESNSVHLIPFSNTSDHYNVTPEKMKSLSISASYDGPTKMANAIQQFHSLFKHFDANKPIRVLTICDGYVADLPDTQKAATDLVKYLDGCNFSINSQAIRLFTSRGQPDTKALCCLMQINNTTTSQLTDISTKASNESIASQIAGLFQSDNFLWGRNLTMNKQIILKFPWQSLPLSQIMLVPGQNVFWLTKIPTGEMMIGDSPVKISMQDPLTLIKFQHLMEAKMVYILNHTKILKALGTIDADLTADSILDYFEIEEDKLTKKFSIVKYFNSDSNSRKKLSIALAAIAKDENIKELNSSSMAEYLRGVGQLQKEKTNFLDVISFIDRVALRIKRLRCVKNIRLAIDINLLLFCFLIVRSVILRKRKRAIA